MNIIIDHVKASDIDELISLYITIYGRSYPLELGTNYNAMKSAIERSDEFFWPVMRDTDRGIIIGSIIFEIDPLVKIGKVSGAVVHKDYRGQKIGAKLVKFGLENVLGESSRVHSLYATSRTITTSSQKMLLDCGFVPLGLFPNARKINNYESLALLGIFANGVLEKRAKLEKIPSEVEYLLNLVNEKIGHHNPAGIIESCPLSIDPSLNFDEAPEGDFEFIFAPGFVKNRFEEVFANDPESSFYPFHRPNLLMYNKTTGLEIFASFNKKDHYCVIISANKSITSLGKNFKKLFFDMKEHGIYYVECLIRLDYFEPICFLMENRFLPSAVYPAMRETEGSMHDYALMTRTMVPLDFSDLKIEPEFELFAKKYASQWINMNLRMFKGDGIV